MRRWPLEANEISKVRTDRELPDFELGLLLVELLYIFHECWVHYQEMSACAESSEDFDQSNLQIVEELP